MANGKPGRPGKGKKFTPKNPTRITIEVGTPEYRDNAARAVRLVSGLDMTSFLKLKLDEAIETARAKLDTAKTAQP